MVDAGEHLRVHHLLDGDHKAELGPAARAAVLPRVSPSSTATPGAM